MAGEQGQKAPVRSAPNEALRGSTEDGPDPLEEASAGNWFDEHLRGLRRTASGERPLYWIIAMAFVAGLAGHAGGYLLKINVTTEPLGLLADLLCTLGWALWTGAVVVVFLQIIPEAKRRQIKRAVDAYESVRRNEAQGSRDRSVTDRTPIEGGGGPGIAKDRCLAPSTCWGGYHKHAATRVSGLHSASLCYYVPVVSDT